MNKIVEILEKAKSCYWPALQNVYMNVTQGEPDTVIHKAVLAPSMCGLSVTNPGELCHSMSSSSAHSWGNPETTTAPPFLSDSPLSTVPCLLTPGLKEANDIVLYLKPLRILLEEMEQADFTVVCQ